MNLTCRLSGLVVAALLVNLLPARECGAAGQRSFVSAAGVENAACSIANPCRSFAAAIAATDAGGEVVVLDSGGYGPVTIAKSVSIIAPAGIYAGISVPSGTGVTIVLPSSGDRVLLQGLDITNRGSGVDGIAFSGVGGLEVVNARISGFTTGVHFNPAPGSENKLRLADVTLDGNGTGVSIDGSLTPGTAPHAVFERVDARRGGNGLIVNRSALLDASESTFALNSTGVVLVTGANDVILATFDRCTITENSANGVATVSSTGGASFATFVDSIVTQNGTGINAGSNTTVRLAGTTIAQNLIGITNDTATVQSQGNNLIHGNSTDGAPPTVVGSK